MSEILIFPASCCAALQSSLIFCALLVPSMAALTILVIGGGGREHALAWKLSQSPLVDRIFVCPGNGGTSLEAKTTNVDLSASDFPALVDFALKHEVRIAEYSLRADMLLTAAPR